MSHPDDRAAGAPASLATPAMEHTLGAAGAMNAVGAAPETLIEAVMNAQQSERSASHGLRFVDVRERETLVPWGEVAARAERTALHLRQIGVERGRRVALVFSTCPEFFDGFFGALLAGAVPVPLYPPVRLGKMEQYDQRTSAMLKAAQAQVVLAEARVIRLLGGVKARFYAPLGYQTLETLSQLSSAELTGTKASPSTATSVEGDLELESMDTFVSPDDLALVQFSSGTTVAPKPVALSHAALLHQASILAGHWPDTEAEEQAGVSWLPLYHDMGLIGCVIPGLLRVANLWLLPPEVFLARPALWLRTLSRSKATVSPAPNFAYSLCTERVRDKDLEGVDLSHWRAALNGAEAVSIETVRAFSERLAPHGFQASSMTPVYGLAEAALAVTFSDLDAPPTATRFCRDALTQGRARTDSSGQEVPSAELVSVGVPVPGFAIEVRANDGSVLEEGQEGEVFAKGPSLLSGYLDSEGVLQPALDNGWLGTGDLGFVHGGELYLTGRKKDVLVLRGRNWSAVPIEECVSAVSGVRTGCVVAVSALLGADETVPGERRKSQASKGGTEQLWIIAETRAPEENHEEIRCQIQDAVLAGVGLVIARLDLVEPGAIPRTSSGKLRRASAKALGEAGQLKRAGAASLIEKIKRRPSVEAALALLHSRAELRREDLNGPGSGGRAVDKE